MRVIVTGAQGQLGYDVCRELSTRGIEHIGLGMAQLDFTDKLAVDRVLEQYHPTTVIHCGAYTAVDKAEDEEQLCYNVNATGSANIANACKAVGASMMYISTEYVFDGHGEHYKEVDEPTRPLGVYGESKLSGEKVVSGILDQHYIVRISWLFGVNGNNFVKTMLGKVNVVDSLRVVNDQIGSPTYSVDLARGMVDLLLTGKYGVYHITNEGCCSWHEFAEAIFARSNAVMHVEPIPSSSYVTKATRPLNSRLSKDCLDRVGVDRLPSWQDALDRFLVELSQSGQHEDVE